MHYITKLYSSDFYKVQIFVVLRQKKHKCEKKQHNNDKKKINIWR